MVRTIADENVRASLQFHINWLISLQVTLDAKGLNKMQTSKHMLFLLPQSSFKLISFKNKQRMAVKLMPI